MIAQKWQLPVLISACAAAIYFLSPVLTPFAAGLLLAWLGNPFVERLQKAGCTRSVAVILVFGVVMLLSVLSFVILLPLLWQQLLALIRGAPTLITWAQNVAMPWLAANFNQDVASMFDPSNLATAAQQHWKEIGNFAALILGYASKSSVAALVFFSNALLLPVLFFYFLRDWPIFTQQLQRLIPRNHAPKLLTILAESDIVLAGFLRGQLLVMLSLGSLYALGLWLTGLSSGLLIGFIAGLVCFVPYLGAAVGVISAVVASLIQYGDVSHLWLIALVFVLGQLIESFVLTPWLVGDRIGLHPVAVIFSIMAGGQLFGFVGVLLALPVAAVINVVLKHAHAHYLQSELYGQAAPVSPEPTRPDV